MLLLFRIMFTRQKPRTSPQTIITYLLYYMKEEMESEETILVDTTGTQTRNNGSRERIIRHVLLTVVHTHVAM